MSLSGFVTAVLPDRPERKHRWTTELCTSLVRQNDADSLAREFVGGLAAALDASVTLVVDSEAWHCATASATVEHRLHVVDELRELAERDSPGAYELCTDRAVAIVPVGEARARRGAVLLNGTDAAALEENARTVAEFAPLLDAALANLSTYRSLESLVEEEMTAAVRREEHIELLMDSMSDGLVVCELNGTVTGTQSRAARELLGNCQGKKIWDVLSGEGDPDMAEVAYEQLAENVLPFDVSAAMMPRQLEHEDRVLRLTYSEVVEAGTLAYVMVHVRDATAEVAAEKADSERRQLTNIVSHLIADHAGFTALLQEFDDLTSQLSSATDRAVVMRLLHTLKGSAALFGFDSVAECCHQLEQQLTDGRPLTPRDVEYLQGVWKKALAGIDTMLAGGAATEDLTVLRGEYNRLVTTLEQTRNVTDIRELISTWDNEAVRDLLATPARQAERIARSLGKTVKVVVEHNDVRILNVAQRDLFRNLVHLIRNALDHGIEPPEERVRLGKCETATLRITVERVQRDLVLEVEDDGRGIDWERVREAAKRRGLPCGTRADLIEALMSDGLSTRETATQLSGRGVGISAFSESCANLDARLEVNSEAGRGTVFRCTVSSDCAGESR